MNQRTPLNVKPGQAGPFTLYEARLAKTGKTLFVDVTPFECRRTRTGFLLLNYYGQGRHRPTDQDGRATKLDPDQYAVGESAEEATSRLADRLSRTADDLERQAADLRAATQALRDQFHFPTLAFTVYVP